jgi:hypothetical protein
LTVIGLDRPEDASVHELPDMGVPDIEDERGAGSDSGDDVLEDLLPDDEETSRAGARQGLPEGRPEPAAQEFEGPDLVDDEELAGVGLADDRPGQFERFGDEEERADPLLAGFPLPPKVGMTAAGSEFEEVIARRAACVGRGDAEEAARGETAGRPASERSFEEGRLAPVCRTMACPIGVPAVALVKPSDVWPGLTDVKTRTARTARPLKPRPPGGLEKPMVHVPPLMFLRNGTFSPSCLRPPPWRTSLSLRIWGSKVSTSDAFPISFSLESSTFMRNSRSRGASKLAGER